MSQKQYMANLIAPNDQDYADFLASKKSVVELADMLAKRRVDREERKTSYALEFPRTKNDGSNEKGMLRGVSKYVQGTNLVDAIEACHANGVALSLPSGIGGQLTKCMRQIKGMKITFSDNDKSQTFTDNGVVVGTLFYDDGKGQATRASRFVPATVKA
jgi:hypothetical protein